MKKKTKIIATIGPSCYSLDVLKRMKKNGMNIARINTKHFTEKKIKEVYPLLNKIRDLEILFDISHLETLDWVNKYKYDYLAVSFAVSGKQIKHAKELVPKSVKVIAKIESRKGVENFEKILKESYGIMIGRGDLSKNISYEKVPIVQKHIIKKCNQRRKMSITATEMLLSLMKSKSPANAGVSDVANAVFDGSCALMLSEETAIGKYPAVAVKVMNNIIREIEREIRK